MAVAALLMTLLMALLSSVLPVSSPPLSLLPVASLSLSVQAWTRLQRTRLQVHQEAKLPIPRTDR